MKIFKVIKPTTPSKRQLISLINKNEINKKPLLKTKILGTNKTSGRNHSGKITVFHKGGGAKKKYRAIEFTRTLESRGIVCSIEYDPNRKAYIASVYDYLKKQFFYILAPQNLKIGDIVKSGFNVEQSLGNSLPISNIAEGTYIHNISTKVYKKAQIARSAGTFSIVKEKTEKNVILELSSNKLLKLEKNCFASIGEVSNKFYFLVNLGKAGRSRWLNVRPTVRGVAMNPVDHPHGGGEGKKSGKKLSPWGKL